ncbi:type I polyketide synthase [Aquimarina sp. RZ0]|uniref:type I polyketide synthase n=1 Tax=Aquimarina sp. RZ0 TaxID=2607730 RepID=UPI0011F2381D|nr:type I polyketide synthase [Aquimarina sp. RZ0]KAA1246841.1 4'-phosphopantetheinyl transferase superfamily protein [Aquimarina sp. RZ0]
MNQKNDIAIVGMSCMFPGAKDIHTYWNNIRNRVDAISDVPENRWESRYYDPSSTAIDRFYCKRGGFVDNLAEFDPIEFGIVPITVQGTEPDHLITLKMAKAALEDASVFDKNTPTDKTGIILGKGNYLGTGITRLVEQLRTGEHLVNLLNSIAPDIAPSEMEKIRKGFQKQTGRFGPDTAMGLIPNLAASLVANRLNLGGTAYTIDAACASSLIAIDHAVQELTTGRCNMVIAGGVHLCQNVTFYSVFTQLGALSKQQQIRPFDQKADGLLIGEGCGMVVLKRLEDAIEDEDRIYAVIKGTGIASDGSATSIMSPAVSGQTRAIKQAWDQAGIAPEEVGYIEAHGTGTQLGDATEIETLKNVFGNRSGKINAGLGTVKSMIGHTMPAAGIAGLIKTAMALYHGELPPTLHCQTPLETIKDSGFSIISETRDWDQEELPRRAGVNAFGFGGINAHVVLEGYHTSKNNTKKKYITPATYEKDELLLLTRDSSEALITALEQGDYTLGKGIHRLALFNPTLERIEKAIKIVKKGKAWRNRNDIWYTSSPLLLDGGKLCFLFPGLDALANNSVDDIYEYFEIEKIHHAESSELVESGVSVFKNSIVTDIALKKLGIIPDCIAGHSLGEWIGFYSAGIANREAVLKMLSEFDINTIKVPDVYFLAVGAGVDVVTPILKKIGNVYLTHDNCLHQSIICGTEESINECKRLLQDQQVFNQVLPFQSGFHSPFFEDFSYQLEDKLNVLQNKSSIPLWSATTVAPYPEDIEDIRVLSMEHLVKPVRFKELIQTLHQQENVKAFVQIGAGGLIGFTDDTLKGMTYSGLSANSVKRSGINQLQRVVAAMFIEGKDVDISFLHLKRREKKNHNIKLQLGLPLVTEFEAIAIPKQEILVTENKISSQENNKNLHPILQSFHQNFEAIQSAQKEIAMALTNSFDTVNEQSININTHTFQNELLYKESIPADFEQAVELSLERYPDLIDHSMYMQKSGWPYIGDRFPVVPMTMLIELMADAVQQNLPDYKIIRIENIQAFKWTDVTSPIHLILTGSWKNSEQVNIRLGDYAVASITVGKEFDKPAFTTIDDIGVRKHIPISEKEVYEKKYMFHGPKYQGITKFIAMGNKGMKAVISNGGGKGSLLDNAGQLFGLWCHLVIPHDHVAFPVKIEKIQFFEAYTSQSEPLECTCQVIEETEDFLSCRMILQLNGTPWAIIDGWRNRRLGFNKKLWNTSLSVLENKLSEEIIPNVFLFEDVYRRSSAWDYIKKKYLNMPEKEGMESLPLSKRKQWLMGRVVAKDAVRVGLKKNTFQNLYPAEIGVKSTSDGKPYVIGEGVKLPEMEISIAHKEKIAVAIASFQGKTGIDIEEIKDRGASFLEVSFSLEELKLIPEGEDRWEWVTRFWTAKEAYGKSLGLGLQGNPKKYCITEINGTDLYINKTQIKTKKHKNFIIGWI